MKVPLIGEIKAALRIFSKKRKKRKKEEKEAVLRRYYWFIFGKPYKEFIS